MDDFRVGSVPPSEPYGDRHPYDVASRRHKRHHHDESGEGQEEETTDTYEAASESAEPSQAGGEIEDYYRPAPPLDE